MISDDDGSVTVEHAWADTPYGPIHYVTAGTGDPVLLLHQTPRSWDEYRDVVPIVGRRHRVIAMDSLGFGDTPRPDGEELTIELLARGAMALLDALGIERATIVGHHTGGIVGVEIGASFPERVSGLVLSATPLINQQWRDKIGPEPRIDVIDRIIDGSHIASLWAGRQPFYPPDRVDLLERFIVDALRTPWGPSIGHRAVQTYVMEDKVAAISAPVICVLPAADPFVNTEVAILAEALGAEVVEIEGGMIPLPDHMPDEFAEVVLRFLDAPGPTG